MCVSGRYVFSICVFRCDKKSENLPVIVDGRNVLRIDTTVAKNLALLVSDLATRNQKLIFWNWSEDAKQTLICYDPSIAAYCKSSDSIIQIFKGKISDSHNFFFNCLFINRLLSGLQYKYFLWYIFILN